MKIQVALGENVFILAVVWAPGWSSSWNAKIGNHKAENEKPPCCLATGIPFWQNQANYTKDHLRLFSKCLWQDHLQRRKEETAAVFAGVSSLLAFLSFLDGVEHFYVPEPDWVDPWIFSQYQAQYHQRKRSSWHPKSSRSPPGLPFPPRIAWPSPPKRDYSPRCSLRGRVSSLRSPSSDVFGWVETTRRRGSWMPLLVLSLFFGKWSN